MVKWHWSEKEPIIRRIFKLSAASTTTLDSPKVAKDVLEVYTRIVLYTSFITGKPARIYHIKDDVESIIGVVASSNSSTPVIVETDTYLEFNDYIKGRIYTQDAAQDNYLWMGGYRRIKIYDK